MNDRTNTAAQQGACVNRGRDRLWSTMNTTAIQMGLLFMVAAVCMLGACPTPCLADSRGNVPIQELEAIVESIHAALDSVQLANTGRGVAQITGDPETYGTWGKEPVIADFVFQGESSRIDRFESIDGNRQARRHAQVVTDKYTYGINRRYASVDRAFPNPHTNFGRDFHPDVFMHIRGMPVRIGLNYLLSPKRRNSAHIDSDGVIRMESRWSSNDPSDSYDHALRLSFDPQKAFLPVVLETEWDFHGRPEDSGRLTTTLDWAKYGTAWYVSSGKFERYNSQAATLTEYEQFSITKFDPHAEIGEKEFTLEGLGPTQGMTVIDAVTGIDYRYGAPLKTIADLEAPLDKAAFVQKVKKDQEFPDSSESASSASRSSQGNDNIGGISAPLTVKEPVRPRWPAISVAAVGVLALTTIIALVGYRRALARIE